jgi:hypothetical protein
MTAAGELVLEVETKARALYEQQLDPISTRFEFEASPPPAETRGLPIVLLLGNHSSGKSSFVNWLAGTDLQRTGIAPIDDGFTIISNGPVADMDGASIVTNPGLPWGDLQRFGPQLTSHLRLKQRALPAIEGIALIDSPGMIDAADTKVTRGYNFQAVVRWFAERADVVLLMFDPDKPGTTGETLSVLTESLGGLEHKLLIIFNKVDVFASMRDYARAYGALCWNLSKAIPRKDLPHIFNTYLPQGESTGKKLPLDDFDKQREEVRVEVHRAPFRRVDNIVSRLYQHARRLRVHVTVLDQLARERWWMTVRYAAGALAILWFTGLIGYLGYSYAPDAQRWTFAGVATVVAVAGLGALGGLYAWDRRARERDLSLDALFQRAYARELTLGDDAEDLQALWISVRDRVRRALEARGGAAPKAWITERRRLERVIDKDIPELRALASKR